MNEGLICIFIIIESSSDHCDSSLEEEGNDEEMKMMTRKSAEKAEFDL